MKWILISALLVLSIQVMGQAPTFKPYLSPNFSQKPVLTDTTIKVTYTDKFEEFHNTKETALFLNGRYVNASIMVTLQPDMVDSMYVVKEKIAIDNISYDAQIIIKTKTNYNPKLLSLNDLKTKYVKLKTKHTVFMLDGNIIDADYDTYKVDENYILQILVETLRNTKGNKNIGFVKLLTRSPENIKKSKDIRIRGVDVSLNR